jgi:hypothetical protein
MNQSSYYFRKSCRMCESESLLEAISLTPTPPGNDFLNKKELGRDEPVYPLDLYFCSNCFHIQLGHVVNPKILYQNNYTYVSATSQHFVNYLKGYAESMTDRFNLKKNDLVVDIGSNDGTCLSFFKNKGMRVLGVDPAIDIAKKATSNGVETIADFFGYNLSTELKNKFGPAKYITSHNACAHIDNLIDVIRGVEYWLDQDGIFVLEVGYFADVYKNTWFDTIYHEHLDYHTVAPFEYLFDRVGMEIISVEQITPQGGSIRVMTQKKGGNRERDQSVNDLISIERNLGLQSIDTLHEFKYKISSVNDKLKKIVSTLKRKGKTIAGFGAPTKATTLMAHFGLDNNILDFIVDDNPLKQGLFTPITHIPVLSSDALYDLKPDYVIVLAWNFAEQIMHNHSKYAKDIGRFILPMPEPRIT